MRNIKLLIRYDGTDFHGWQHQPGHRTVQQSLETAIEYLTGQRSTTTASGRTDSGVHALGQVVHFFTNSGLPIEVFVKGLNAHLPSDVRILEAKDAPQSFHATLDAEAKLYRYTIDNGPIADPFQLRYAWHVFQPLDHQAMHQAAQGLLGWHDFRSFETNWPNRTSSVRTITHIAVHRTNSNVHVEVEADGFLYNMVRSITGTLVLVGQGKRAISWPKEVLLAKDRRRAGPTAPPQGLFMIRVRY